MNELQLTDDVLVQFFTQFKSATRKLVKQQITWFRSEPMYTWIDLSSKEMEPKTQILKKWKKLSFRSAFCLKGRQLTGFFRFRSGERIVEQNR